MARVVFMGSPNFAVPSLEALQRQHTVVGVVTQPDRPAGRGQRVAQSAVRQAARELDLPVIQPASLRSADAVAALRQWAPDVIVVAAFGQILRPAVLDLPPHGCLNVHASLLPRHRGAAPVVAAILAGEAESGVTIMRMDAGLDTGPILAQRATHIGQDDTGGTLTARLARLGADLLADTLPGYLAGAVQARPQDEALATYARQLKKADGQLDWARPAGDLARRVRAFSPWPGAFTVWQGKPLRVLRARPDLSHTAPPGNVIEFVGLIGVGAGAGMLVLEEVQPAGRKPMAAIEFARGARGFVGSELEHPGATTIE